MMEKYPNILYSGLLPYSPAYRLASSPRFIAASCSLICDRWMSEYRTLRTL
jgi:hypothetical protein